VTGIGFKPKIFASITHSANVIYIIYTGGALLITFRK